MRACAALMSRTSAASRATSWNATSERRSATELSPAQIQAKLEKDPVLWNAKIEALRNVGLEVMEIVKNKNVNELWDAGDNLDRACETCHVEYWYPGDKALLEKVDRGIQQRYEQSQREGKQKR